MDRLSLHGIREYYIPDFSQWERSAKFKEEFEKLVRDLKKRRRPGAVQFLRFWYIVVSPTSQPGAAVPHESGTRRHNRMRIES